MYERESTESPINQRSGIHGFPRHFARKSDEIDFFHSFFLKHLGRTDGRLRRHFVSNTYELCY